MPLYRRLRWSSLVFPPFLFLFLFFFYISGGYHLCFYKEMMKIQGDFGLFDHNFPATRCPMHSNSQDRDRFHSTPTVNWDLFLEKIGSQQSRPFIRSFEMSLFSNWIDSCVDYWVCTQMKAKCLKTNNNKTIRSHGYCVVRLLWWFSSCALSKGEIATFFAFARYFGHAITSGRTLWRISAINRSRWKDVASQRHAANRNFWSVSRRLETSWLCNHLVWWLLAYFEERRPKGEVTHTHTPINLHGKLSSTFNTHS